MSLRIICPECKTACKVDDDVRGKKIRCRECDRLLSVPAGKSDLVDMELEEDQGFYEPRGKSAPLPGPKRVNRDDDDDRAAPRRDRDGSGSRQAGNKKGKSGLVPVLLIGCGSLAVLGVVGIVAVIAGVFAFKSAPADEPVPMVQNGQPPPFQGGFNNNGGPGPDFFQGQLPEKLDNAAMQRVKRSTVYLQVTLPGGMKSEGSGFFAIEPGIVITNAHVLGMLQAQSQPPTNVDVVIHSGEQGEATLRGTVAGVDRDTDLAVLRVAADDLPPPLMVGTAQSLKELQKVHYFGFPFGKGLGPNITVGNAAVSSLRKNPFGAIYQIQLDGNMQPGNSGGPLVDTSGRVVGVAVAIIKNTGTNFAVPADFVKLALDGRIAQSTYGEPFLENNEAKLPVKYECLDPLGRVQSVQVEIWVGDKGPDRPFANQAPAPLPGDGPRQTINVTYQNGKAVGNIPLPALEPGKVHWVQPVLVNGSGMTQWQPALALTPAAPLQRLAANLLMKVNEPGERTVRIKDAMRMTVFEGNNKFSDGLEFEADLLEVLTPEPTGTAIRVTIGANKFSEELNGKLQSIDPKYFPLLKQLSPNFLVDRTGRLLKRGVPDNPKLLPKDKETLENMLMRVCNAFEEVCVYMPNRQINPMETWQAKVPTIVGKGPKAKVLDIELTCTYEGTRITNGRNEAFIGLVGAIKGREKTDKVALGKVAGRAMLDLQAGFVSQITMKLSSEMEFGLGVQMVMSEDISLTRVAGNTQNIVAYAAPKKGPPPPDPKPKTDPPVTKKDPPPADPKPKPDPTPAGPKLIFEANERVVASDFLGPKGRKCKTHEVKLEAGKTYVIEMKKVGVSTFNPFLMVLDAGGKVLAQDDDSGDNKNAKITFQARESGTYKVVATSSIGAPTGAYHLTVTAVPPQKKE